MTNNHRHKKSVTIGGLTFTGTLTPEEPMRMYYKDGSGHPGSPAEFEITEITGNPIKLIEYIESMHPDIWEELSNKCLEYIKDDCEDEDLSDERYERRRLDEIEKDNSQN